MKEETLQPLESLALIDSMINKAKDRFFENGHMYLLWGWLIFFCSMAHFLLQYVFKVEHFYAVWFLTWVALVYQFFYLAKKRKRQKVVTYTGHIIGYVWLVFIVMMVLLSIVVVRSSESAQGIGAVILVLYGMPTFLSGIILKFPALVRGGIFCWLLSLFSLIIPVQFHMLLITVAITVAWIVPGYLLKSHFKKMNS